ncbi:MAG: helix-turn-helix transcriptional regulator [Myxococcota bacterium]
MGFKAQAARPKTVCLAEMLIEKQLRQRIRAILQKERSKMRMTQEDIAERIGISATFYGRLERGEALPSVETLYAITTVLEISADYLLGLATHRKQSRS